jgi:Arc/MetJ-type ribon-helix-helix transcriptional regulator
MQRSMLVHMSTQIAVRLPDEMVALLDRAVAAGEAPSRAALVTSALEREMRRLIAEHDARILGAKGAADDLDDLVAWTSTHIRVED